MKTRPRVATIRVSLLCLFPLHKHSRQANPSCVLSRGLQEIKRDKTTTVKASRVRRSVTDVTDRLLSTKFQSRFFARERSPMARFEIVPLYVYPSTCTLPRRDYRIRTDCSVERYNLLEPRGPDKGSKCST